ncbi:hypothetical protein JFV28_20425 [Pseudomonas sp. TH05]|uniref:hypothetical protein n=1 Tax=unclassified Pseudomonas TaxID=196821 RepID=UPI0019113B1C|nr:MULTISPECIES: hypothetical protein [unclassified Pseudomonas]MBK5541509.1 hypothetical protein [Pseudomonas sp. TH07]MBK5558212.1 hypothetical protein [Pseudomonas sp. TH05]
MSFYQEMAVVALDMITEFGQPVTIRDIIKGEYDPDTSTTSPDSVVERIAQGILLDFTGQEFHTNTLIKVGDKKLKIAAAGLGPAPSLLSKVVVQGKAWTIIPPLKEINPAGTPILYEFQLRS